jgi:hypothetical protein
MMPLTDSLLVYASVEMLSMYHDWLLQEVRCLKANPQSASSLNRYNSVWLFKSKTFRQVAYGFAILKSVQVLGEMVAKELGGSKW